MHTYTWACDSRTDKIRVIRAKPEVTHNMHHACRMCVCVCVCTHICVCTCVFNIPACVYACVIWPPMIKAPACWIMKTSAKKKRVTHRPRLFYIVLLISGPSTIDGISPLTVWQYQLAIYSILKMFTSEKHESQRTAIIKLLRMSHLPLMCVY